LAPEIKSLLEAICEDILRRFSQNLRDPYIPKIGWVKVRQSQAVDLPLKSPTFIVPSAE